MPWRYSPVVPTMPRMSSSAAPMPAPEREFSRSASVLKSPVAKLEALDARVSRTIAARKPKAVRVVRSLSSSALTSMPSRRARLLAGQLEEDVLERGRALAQAVDRHPLAQRQVADRRRIGAGDHQQAALAALHAMAARRSAAASRSAPGLRTSTAPPRPAVSSATDPWATTRPRRDHDRGVRHLGDLGQHVARHEHRAPLRRVPAHEVAQPADPLRIESVGRLVEDQDLGLAEEGGGEGKALAHPERVVARAPRRRLVECHGLQGLVRARLGIPAARATGPQVVPGAAAGVEARALEHGADRPRRVGQLPVRAAVERSRVPLDGSARPRIMRRVVVLPAPLGPRKPVTFPGWTSKLTSSTAVTEPKRFVSERTSIGAMPRSYPAGRP